MFEKYDFSPKLFIFQTMLKSQWLFPIIYDIIEPFLSCYLLLCHGKMYDLLKKQNKQRFIFFTPPAYLFMDI